MTCNFTRLKLRIAFETTGRCAVLCSLSPFVQRGRIGMKYRHVHSLLQEARSELDENDEVDHHLALVLDHIMKTVLRIEHLAEAKHKVVQFPAWRRKGPLG